MRTTSPQAGWRAGPAGKHGEGGTQTWLSLSRLRLGVARRSEGASGVRKAATAISKRQDPASRNFTQARLKERAYQKKKDTLTTLSLIRHLP